MICEPIQNFDWLITEKKNLEIAFCPKIKYNTTEFSLETSYTAPEFWFVDVSL